MIADLLSPNDRRWSAFLDRAPHSIYHLPEYSGVAGQYEGGEPVAFYAEEDDHALLIPLLVRELPRELGAPTNWRDATSPYGYAGPLSTAGIGTEALGRGLSALRELARARDIVSAFIRFNPLRSISIDAFGAFGSVVNHGPIVYVDLTKTADEWWAETRSGHRENIVRLTRSGYSVTMDDWSAYEEFRTLYATTMQRRSARAFYFFTDEYFAQLRAMLGDRLHLCTVRGPSGDVAASALFMLTNGIAEYHLSGTAEQHIAKAPTKLMLDFARRWAKEHGASILNLGGGFGGSASSLYHFKTGFSRSQADFHSARVVFDADRYEDLVGRRLRSADAPPDGYFPSYRQPYVATTV